MAKDKKKRDEDPVATALTAPDTPVETSTAGPTARTVPAGGPPERLGNGTRSPGTSTTTPALPQPSPSVADSLVSAASDAARVVQGVLPHRFPAYLGGAALLVLGVVDLPALAGGALAYEAIRRWQPAPPRRPGR
jgi:hypothetical protein